MDPELLPGSGSGTWKIQSWIQIRNKSFRIHNTGVFPKLFSLRKPLKKKNIDNVVTVAWLLVIISVCNIYSWSSFREWEKNISCYLYLVLSEAEKWNRLSHPRRVWAICCLADDPCRASYLKHGWIIKDFSCMLTSNSYYIYNHILRIAPPSLVLYTYCDRECSCPAIIDMLWTVLPCQLLRKYE